MAYDDFLPRALIIDYVKHAQWNVSIYVEFYFLIVYVMFDK